MKRLLLAVSLIILCINACVICEISLNRRTEALTRVVSQCVYFSAEEDTQNALIYSEKAQELWKESEQLFYMLLIHDNIQELCVGIPQLPALARENDMQQLYYISLECLNTLVLVDSSHGLSWGNVF